MIMANISAKGKANLKTDISRLKFIFIFFIALFYELFFLHRRKKSRRAQTCALTVFAPPEPSESAKTIYESGYPAIKRLCRSARYIPIKSKKRAYPLFFRLVSLLVTVAACAVFAVAGISDVNAVKFTVHAVLIELTVGNTAGNAAIDVLRHFRSSLMLLWTFS